MIGALHTPWGKFALPGSSQGAAEAGETAGVTVSPAVAVLIAAIAAHDRIEPGALLARLAADRAREIGLSALARAVLDSDCARGTRPGAGVAERGGR